MTKISKAQISQLIKLLKSQYKNPNTELRFKNPVEMMIATILSAQCTDKRVNLVTKTLFKKYKSTKSYAEADWDELSNDIKSTGFYRQKAKNIIAACSLLIDKHQGQVPNTIEELIQLPGVGRKTANVVLYHIYGINEGIAVDTHVGRLSKRLGLTKERFPEKIEQDLIKLIPQKTLGEFSNLLISHGRAVCYARNPQCSQCFLASHCPSKKKYSK